MAQRKEPVPDSVLTNKVRQQLANRGLRTPCRLNVDVRKGVLTLTGQVQYPHQRDAALSAIRSIDGLSRINEQIQVRPPAKHQYKTLPPLPKETEGETAAPGEPEAAAAESSGGSVAPENPQADGASPPKLNASGSPELAAGGDQAESTDFDLGPAQLTPAHAEIEPAAAAPEAKAGGESTAAEAVPSANSGETDEDESGETDFDLGPAELTVAHSVQTEPSTPTLDVEAGEEADKDDSSTTDFDLGPAPVNLRSAS